MLLSSIQTMISRLFDLCETVVICKAFKNETNMQNRAIERVVFLARTKIICNYHRQPTKRLNLN
jgi:hypothetical protein